MSSMVTTGGAGSPSLSTQVPYAVIAAAFDEPVPFRLLLLGGGGTWAPDIEHEYHLVRNADHGGPTMRPPPAGATTTHAFVGSLRTGFEPAPASIGERGPAIDRRYGSL